MNAEPDPSDVDTSGRGETQPRSREATERFGRHADRIDEHREPAGDSAAVHGPAEHDDASEATVGSGPESGAREPDATDESPGADRPQPRQARPENARPQPERHRR